MRVLFTFFEEGPMPAIALEVTDTSTTLTILSCCDGTKSFLPDHHRRLKRDGELSIHVPLRPQNDGDTVLIDGTIDESQKGQIAEILRMEPDEFSMSAGLERLTPRRMAQMARYTLYVG